MRCIAKTCRYPTLEEGMKLWQSTSCAWPILISFSITLTAVLDFFLHINFCIWYVCFDHTTCLLTIWPQVQHYCLCLTEGTYTSTSTQQSIASMVAPLITPVAGGGQQQQASYTDPTTGEVYPVVSTSAGYQQYQYYNSNGKKFIINKCLMHVHV